MASVLESSLTNASPQKTSCGPAAFLALWPFFDLLRSDLIFFAHCRHGAARLDRGDHGGGEDGVDDGGGEDGQWWRCWWRGLVKERSQAKVYTWA